ncbi:unnamed protein product [Arabis nemorensis]|uniref:Uncharacterized protein n=1 Tax=Arabis nemorensis TaxID=586526 RepID=A0A565C0D3_9BRAS|nr:unnamed protein product [Arabis nemorensis]
MSLGSDLTVLEELTSNAKQIQDDVLTEILKANANTEYLSRFLHGSSDKELFKKNVRVVSYEDMKPYIDLYIKWLCSSGTSSGNPKIFPANNIFFEKVLFVSALRSLVMSKHFDGLKQGKMMRFVFSSLESTTPCGLPFATSTPSFIKSEYFRNQPKNLTSPDQVILCPDAKQSAIYASGLLQAIHFLENYWKELSNNIRFGHVSEGITDRGCRDSVSIILGEPNPELADVIER